MKALNETISRITNNINGLTEEIKKLSLEVESFAVDAKQQLVAFLSVLTKIAKKLDA